MPFTAVLLMIAALVPLAGFVALLGMGRRMGAPLAGHVATAFVAVSFLCSGWALMRWIGGGSFQGHAYGTGRAPLVMGDPTDPASHAAPHGPWHLSVYVDSLTVGLFVTITLTAMLVCIFATRSVRRDPRFERMFLGLTLCCFAALAMMLVGTLRWQLAFFEILSVCAVMLMRFRPAYAPSARAAARMFVVHRFGDVGLVAGAAMLLVLAARSSPGAGMLSMVPLWHLAASGALPTGLLTAAGVALFFGAASRAAQFPFHLTAADAAEVVAPVAATVWSVALAVGAVYLVARWYPMFTPSARLLIAIVGLTSALAAALRAMVEYDAKRILALVAAAQAGLMMMALGTGSWTGATFHLCAYVYLQTLLFLAVGAVVRAARGQADARRFGGLLRPMPVTGIAAAAGVLAATGAGWAGVGLSGHYSQNLILRDAAAFSFLAEAAGRSPAYRCFAVLPIIVAGSMAFALARWWALLFLGQPRDPRTFERAREVPTLYWPLVVLTIMTALAGRWLGVPDLLDNTIGEARQALLADGAAGAGRTLDAVWPTDEDDVRHDDSSAPAIASALHRGARWDGRWHPIAWLIGVLGGLFAAASAVSPRPSFIAVRRVAASMPPARWARAWLAHGMYFDDVADVLIVPPVRAVVRILRWIDRRLAWPALRLARHTLWALRRPRPAALPPAADHTKFQI